MEVRDGHCKRVTLKRIEAFEMWIWRCMLKISWMEHSKNNEVLKQLKQEGNS